MNPLKSYSAPIVSAFLSAMAVAYKSGGGLIPVVNVVHYPS